MSDEQDGNNVNEEVEVQVTLFVSHLYAFLGVANVMGVKQGGEQANEADNKPPRYEDTDKFLDFVGGGFKKGFYDGSIHKRLEYCEAKKSKQIVERDNGEAQIFQDCAYVPHGAEQGGKQTATDVNEGECDGKVEPIGLIEK